MNAGEPVSTDRLTEELWGGSPPADAPTALQAHVSRLRKLLEPAHGGEPSLLVTRPEGYALVIDTDQLDLNRFEADLREARRELEQGDPEAASRTLGAALDLWRGQPLAGLEYEAFAADEIRRLDERRLEAVEVRIEADLAQGRHAALTAELDELVREHPLREGLRGQLMLALYRSGRQADALAVYDEGRRLFAEELGIEPGARLQQLQAGILAHDAGLDPPAGPATRRAGPATVPRFARRRLPVGVALAAVAAIGVAIAVIALTGGGGEASAAPTEGTVYALSAQIGERPDEAIEIGGSPAAVSADATGLWTLDADGQTISRIDPGSGGVSTFGVGATPIDLESGAGGLWVEVGRRVRGGQTAGPVGTAITRVDPTTSSVRGGIAIPHRGAAVVTASDD